MRSSRARVCASACPRIAGLGWHLTPHCACPQMPCRYPRRCGDKSVCCRSSDFHPASFVLHHGRAGRHRGIELGARRFVFRRATIAMQCADSDGLALLNTWNPECTQPRNMRAKRVDSCAKSLNSTSCSTSVAARRWPIDAPEMAFIIFPTTN